MVSTSRLNLLAQTNNERNQRIPSTSLSSETDLTLAVNIRADGKERRRSLCHSPTPVYFSVAVVVVNSIVIPFVVVAAYSGYARISTQHHLLLGRVLQRNWR